MSAKITRKEQIEKLCAQWANKILEYNQFAETKRERIEHLLSRMSRERQIEVLDPLSDFIFEAEEVMTEEVGKLDDHLSEIEMAIMNVSLISFKFSQLTDNFSLLNKENVNLKQSRKVRISPKDENQSPPTV